MANINPKKNPLLPKQLFDEALHARIVEAYLDTKTITETAKTVGISSHWLTDMLRIGRENAETHAEAHKLWLAIQVIRDMEVEEVERAAMEIAKKKEPSSIPIIKFILERRHPDYAPKEQKHSMEHKHSLTLEQFDKAKGVFQETMDVEFKVLPEEEDEISG